MSAFDGGVPLPAPFLPHPGAPQTPWATWERRFGNYLIARSGDTPLPAAQRRALLLCAIGDEAYRVYENLPTLVKDENEDDYDVTIRQLRNHYEPKTNVIVERFQFRQRGQQSHESTADYAAVLHGLAKKCNFGAMEDELIRDQIVEKTPHNALRQRLLQEHDLTLPKLLGMAEAHEQALQQAATIQHGVVAAPPVPAVAKVETRKGHQQPAQTVSTPCTNCGRHDHPVRDPSCPARHIVCHICNRQGHFAAWCRSRDNPEPRGGGSKPKKPGPRGGRSGSSRSRPQAVRELHVLACEQGKSTKLSCPVTITAGDITREDVHLQVDTGATCSLLSLQRAKQLFKGVSYEPTSANLYGFGHNPIQVHGTLPAIISYNERKVNASFYLVDTPRLEAIMGMDVLSALGLTLHPASHTIFDLDEQTSASEEQVHLPAIDGYAHRIQLKPDAVPKAFKLRRLPLSVREEVSAELNRLLRADVIERADASQWVSPLAVTRKKDGKLRICTDLRWPNSQIIAEVHPLPTIDDLERNLRGTVYSRIDLKSAYFQLCLHEDSRDITAFLTMDGLFRWKRVPMGLVSSGSAFQKLLDQVLDGIAGCGHYLDDILVSGRTQSEHDARLHAVLARLRAARITVNMQKSVFSQPEVDFCGHRLTKHGVAPLQSAIRAVVDAPHPTDLKELRSFIGTTAWFSRFIPAYSTVVQPLTVMLKKDVPFEWGPAAEHAFNSVKSLISSSPVMMPFSPALDTIVTTDASDRGAGAVLTQIQADGQERPVAYWSRSFTDAEAKYSVSEKEALSAVNAIEHWRIYLWGRHFTLRTDHSALTTLLSPQSANRAGARIARWQSRLMSYSYTVQYKPGHSIPVADTLSRLPLPDTTAAETDSDDVVALVTDAAADVLTEEDIRAASAADPVMEKLRSTIRFGWPDTARKCAPDLRDYFAVRHELQCREDGIVMRGPERVVVPETLRSRYLELAHAGHQGVVRSKQLLRDLAWWPGMATAAAALVKNCHVCCSKDSVLAQQARPAPLQPVQLPDRPWSKLGIDIVGPISAAPPAARFAIVVTDYYSKWPEIALTSTVETDDIIRMLSALWAREGFCDEIISDNGPQFSSEKFRTYLQRRGITHHRSSLYWPRGNAAVERLNREVKSWLQEAAQLRLRTADSFSNHVTQRLALYRTTPHCSTGEAPSVLLHGRRMRLNLPVVEEAAHDKRISDRVAKQQRRNKRNYAARKGVKRPSLRPGDLVRVKKPGHVPKDQSRFSAPVPVTQQLGPATYLLADGTRRNAAHLASVPSGSQDGTGPATPPSGTAGPVTPLLSQPPTQRSPTLLLNQPPAPPPETAPPSTGRTTPPRSQPATADADSADRAMPDSDLAEHELPRSSFGRRRFVPVRLR
ncbi:uncharacterized protein K02A2.6-like [Amphibalanus amphitrite]|uniref:uncharacterized protein K02A2.6-like n=1 Tax=Amphibalanus amphitrite TaxID=1232801 RepID=UPI001C90D39C|nr:uncharacterized protein K02A2.6-like [Amphibalanus amphitrite]